MSEGWLTLPPAEAVVACGGEQHRLRWQAGELEALDHADPEGDRTLAALGGESCPCLELLEAWHRHTDDVRVLVLGPRGAGDRVVAGDAAGAARSAAGGAPYPARPPSQIARGRGGAWAGSAQAFVVSLGSRAPHRPAGPFGPVGRVSRAAAAEQELTDLLGLGGGLPERLVATVAATWRARMAERDRRVARVRPQLHAALHGRVLAATREWLDASAAELELRVLGETGRPRLERRDGVVAAELPFGWLVDVWARGMAVVFGRFCLAATSADGLTWTLSTVDAGLGRPETVRVQLPG